MKKPLIVLASDHGGLTLKQQIKEWLESESYSVEDLGPYQFNPDDDYPLFAFGVAKKVAEYQKQVTQLSTIGILVCRSAGGVTIAANKVKGIRAVAVFDEKSAIHAKEHNNANIVTLSGDWLSFNQAKEILKAFLGSEYKKEARHERRLAQIAKFELEEL